jgi:hypothetical protein
MMKYFLISLSIIALFACNNQKEVSGVIKADSLKPRPIPNAPILAPLKEGEIRNLDNPFNRSSVMLLDSLIISLERTACFGTCPIYVVNIYESGYAEYMGRNFVEKEGLYYTRIKDDYIRAIYQKAVDISFFSFNNSYDNQGISDLPATIIKLNDGTTIKKVYNRYEAPHGLKDLELLMDKIFNQQDWVKKE